MTTSANSTVNSQASQHGCFFMGTSPPFTESVHVSYIVTSTLDSLFATFAVLGNGTVMTTLWRNTSLHSPANAFLCCLVLSDFLTGLLLQPLATAFKVAQILGSKKESCLLQLVFNRLMWILSPVTFFALVAISVEKTLALYLHLRYRTVVTMSRAFVFIVFIWILSIMITLAEPLGLYKRTFNRIILSINILGLTVTTVCYVKVFRVIRRHQTQIKTQKQNETENKARRGLAKLRKSSITMFYIVGIFLLCYVPFLCCMGVESAYGYTAQVKAAKVYCSTLIFLNSSFNVFIYCCRIGEIRRAMIKTLQHYFCPGRKPHDVALSYRQASFQMSQTIRKQETFSETM